MSLVVKSFRIEKEIWDALVAEKQTPSRLIRLFILAGLHQMKIPHYDEILLLTKLEEQARKVGVNTHQAVCALNTTLIKKQSLEEKTLRDLQWVCQSIRTEIHNLVAMYYGNRTGTYKRDRKRNEYPFAVSQSRRIF